MEIVALLRMTGALLVVLALLGGATWAVRRYDLRLPGRIGGADGGRALHVVERLAIDPRRSLLLIRARDREHLILLGPDHALNIDGRAAAAFVIPGEEHLPS